MPYGASAPKYEHLPLIREDVTPDRRKRKPPPPPQPRGSRASLGAALATQITAIEQAASSKPPPAPGVKPHLVFRVPLAPGGSLESIRQRLEESGLTIVSIEPEGAVIAFREDADLKEFRTAVAAYQKGPPPGINPKTKKPYSTTKWDVLQFIDAAKMRALSAADRIGSRLAAAIGDSGQSIDDDRTYTLDVELWHRGTKLLARSDLQDLDRVIRQNPQDLTNKILDFFVGEWVCMARASVKGALLRTLLTLDIVAEIEVPPIPVLDAISAAAVTQANFPPPAKPADDGPRVCVVDTGVTGSHPLLSNNLGHEEAILTAQSSPADTHGHGTMVGGLAVFGNVRACYETGAFSSPVILFSARVLNDQNEFDNLRLIFTQMQVAIDTFIKPPHNCRVFSISIGTPAPAIDPSHPRQTQWAEALDILARDRKIIIVLGAGNNHAAFSTNPATAERILQSYPALLTHPDAKICDPASAAIPLTVGSIAEYTEPAVRRGVSSNNVTRALAAVDQPSSFTRTGPGLDGAVKPDFVEYGGNCLFDGIGSQHVIDPGRPDPGVAVMSFANTPVAHLFAYQVGTSLSAPRVARSAAILWHNLRARLGHDPDPNLVRALLALAAHVPPAAVDLIETHFGANAVTDICGYGRIDLDYALDSTDDRATLLASGRMEIDKFTVFELPIPQEMLDADGDKTIDIALAFDPPVRRRRADYLGVTMSFDLIRGKKLTEVIDAYRAAESGETPDHAISGSSRIAFFPSASRRNPSTLQKGSFTFKALRKDYGKSYWLVVRTQRRWAPDTITHQDFSVAATLRCRSAELYNAVRHRVQTRLRQQQEQRQRARS